jgi:phage terminase Nu1 subunit (DNA packaging protein)
MARFGNGAQLAEELGISRQAVSKAEKTGRITRAASGLFDLDAAAIQYRLHTDPEQRARSLQQKGGGVEVMDPPVLELPPTSDAARLVREKARREAAEADLAELELREKRGEIMAMSEHRRVLFSLTRAIRDALLQIPSRSAALVAAEISQPQCQAILDAEMRKVLQQLAAWQPDAEPGCD